MIKPFLILVGLLSGCAMNSHVNSPEDRPLVESNYLLKQDREAFDQIRSEIPTDVKEENDELALFEQLFANPQKKPADIRNQFNQLLNQKKNKFQKDLKKKREEYVKKERKDRDQFVQQLAQERESFKRNKANKEKTKDFYNELDLKRKDFFSEQKEQRDIFEAQVRDDRKNFADYTKEKQTDFNSRLKIFTDQQKAINKK
jgi:hypothetical protein